MLSFSATKDPAGSDVEEPITRTEAADSEHEQRIVEWIRSWRV
jgi:hypothetical protein